MGGERYGKPCVIAEIGCNHKGEMEIAKKMIEIAALFCEADVVKFQKRCNKELLTEKQYNAPHPNPCNPFITSRYGRKTTQAQQRRRRPKAK